MNDEVIDDCDWCEEKKPLYFIDGLWFCCMECESRYYEDREIRKRLCKIPRFLERKNQIN